MIDLITDRLMQSFWVFMTYFDDSSILFALSVGLFFGLLTLSVFYLLTSVMSPERRRVRAVVNDQPGKSNNRSAKKIETVIAPFRKVLLPTSEKELNATQKRLNSAGYREASAVSVYFFTKMALALILGIVALVVTTYFPHLTTNKIIVIASGAAFFGMLIPSYYLDKKVTERKRRIINAFPDMLDMLVACSEAGLGLNAAFQRVSREIELSHPDLAGEMELVNAEILAGVDRVKALKGLSARTDIPEISGFVSMLAQSVRFGTGIAETLRIYAEDFRDKRMQKAEEEAAKVGTKLLFPLVLCMFPCFFVVAVGPAILSIMKAFSS